MGCLSAGKLPEIVTACVPSGSVTSDDQVMLGCFPAGPVVDLFTNLTYGDDGVTCTVVVAPACGPAPIVRSTRLSLTMTGEITTPVPSSRSPSWKSEASTSTR